MRIRLLAALASALTVGLGLIVLIGLLLDENLGLPADIATVFQDVTAFLLQIAVITIALTVLIGIGNLLLVHLGRIGRRQRGWPYGLVLILSFLAVVVTYITDRETSMLLLETVLVPLESALAGLLLFALVYGAYRMMRRGVTWTSLLFIVTLLVVLLGALPFDEIEPLQTVREWLLAVPVSAGARGLLLGIALATIVTGVRVLVGVDRTYRE
jgi:hypothetical protein